MMWYLGIALSLAAGILAGEWPGILAVVAGQIGAICLTWEA